MFIYSFTFPSVVLVSLVLLDEPYCVLLVYVFPTNQGMKWHGDKLTHSNVLYHKSILY